jgi:hypothetical protein
MAAVPTDCGTVTQSTGLYQGSYSESVSSQASQEIPHRYSTRTALACLQKPATLTYSESDTVNIFTRSSFSTSFYSTFLTLKIIKLDLLDRSGVIVYPSYKSGTTERISMTLDMGITLPRLLNCVFYKYFPSGNKTTASHTVRNNYRITLMPEPIIMKLHCSIMLRHSQRGALH